MIVKTAPLLIRFKRNQDIELKLILVGKKLVNIFIKTMIINGSILSIRGWIKLRSNGGN